jgi:hypothetical protein
MNIFYVYLHIDPRSNQVRYVGKGKENRAFTLTHRSARHKNWINKLKSLGLIPIIQIIENNLSEEEAFSKEKYLIAEYRSRNVDLTNLTDGGEGISGYKHTQETRKKVAEAGKGRTVTDETREKISKGLIGKKRSQETKDKISLLHKGRPSWHKGKVRSEEFKNKVSASKRGKPQTQKARQSSISNSSFKKGFIPWNKGMLGWNSGSDNYRSKEVIDINTGFIWISLTQAAEVYGMSFRTLHNWLTGISPNKSSLRYVKDVV